MEHVEKSIWLPYDPATVFAFLTQPQSLAAVVGRIAEIKVLEREGNQGKVEVVLDLPARKVVKTTGEVKGQENQHLSFQTQEPFPLAFSWRFVPSQQGEQVGTEVLAALDFDLSTFGIPIAGMMVRGIIAGELQEDLARLQALLAAG